MWFKMILLGYCAASLAVTIVTANIVKEATPLKRKQVIETLTFPPLERRQQPLGNQTSLSVTIEPTSNIISTSSTPTSEKPSSTPTSINTPTVVISLEPSSSSTPVPFTTDLSLTSSRTSRGSNDAPYTSSSLETSARPSSDSSTAEEQSSATLTTPQDSASGQTPGSIFVSITSTIRSSTDITRSSGTATIPSSTVHSTSNQASPTSSEAVSSSEIIPTLSSSPVSVPTTGTSQSGSTALVTSRSELSISSTAIQTETSNTPPLSTPQVSVLETSSMLASTQVENTLDVFPATSTSAGQQSTVLLTSLITTVSDSAPSSAIQLSSTSITSDILTSLSHEFTSGQTVLSTSALAPSSSSISQASSTSSEASSAMTEASSTFTEVSSTIAKSSSTITEASSTIAEASSAITQTSSDIPEASSTSTEVSNAVIETSSSNTEATTLVSASQLTTIVVTGSEEASTIPVVTSSSMVSSTAESSSRTLLSSASLVSRLSSASEMLQPSVTPSFIETLFTSTPSATQSLPTPSLGITITSSLAVSGPVGSDLPSALEPSVVPSAGLSSYQFSSTLISSSSEEVVSSSLFAPTSIFIEPPSTESRSIDPTSLATNTTDAIPEFTSSAAPVTNSLAISVPTQTIPLPSETQTFTPSTPQAISSDSVSLVPTVSSFVITSSPPAESSMDKNTTIATTFESVATVLSSSAGLSTSTILPVISHGTAGSSSDALDAGVTSSFAPLETASNNVVSTDTFLNASQTSLTPTSTVLEPSPSTTSLVRQSTSSIFLASESQVAQSQTSSIVELVGTIASLSSTSGSSVSVLNSTVSNGQVVSSHGPTSIAKSSLATNTVSSSSTSDSSSRFDFTSSLSRFDSAAVSTPSGTVTFVPATSSSTNLSKPPYPSSLISNGTQIVFSTPTYSGAITATFSTVYVSSIRSSALDLSTVAFSLFTSVTGAATNQTGSPTSNIRSILSSSTLSPGSESTHSSGKPGIDANSTLSNPTQSSLSTVTGIPVWTNTSTSGAIKSGVTVTGSALPTVLVSGATSSHNATLVDTLQTSQIDLAKLSSATSTTFLTSSSESSVQAGSLSFESSAESQTSASTGGGVGIEGTSTLTGPHISSATPSQTTAAGSPPPLTTSQTAGVAVGGTTFILIAVVAAIFIARRYHVAKNGKRMNTGSVYPEVAYLYDPKAGGGGRGDAEALMSGGTGGIPPGLEAARKFPNHTQRHSTGALPSNRFANAGLSPLGSIRDPAIHRYSESEYVRMDTAKALSAAVAGYAGAQRHSSSYTKYPSDCSNPFSDHHIPSPTFAPFSPDDVRRPELKRNQSTVDSRGEYTQMSTNPYAYLNTAATMYPPISPYNRLAAPGPHSAFVAKRQTLDSEFSTDPFEHDLLLQVDERDRTSDSVTIFAPSPHLTSPRTPRTPRTPFGPKLPIRQPNGAASARSLLSPVAAKYMKQAQQVKIPRKSIASPVLVQVGRSPVIKPFSPPPAAPEPLGWDAIKRHSDKHFSDEQSVPAPLRFASPVIKKNPSHARTKPSLTGAGHALLAGNGLPLTVKIPHMYNKSVGLDVPRVHNRSDPACEDESSDPVVREKRSRELRFADPAFIGKKF